MLSTINQLYFPDAFQHISVIYFLKMEGLHYELPAGIERFSGTLLSTVMRTATYIRIPLNLNCLLFP